MASVPNDPVEYPVYKTGEWVLCTYGPIICDAKIIAAEYFEEPAPLTRLKGMHYYVHYKGWKDTWDEWVHVARLLKLNADNLALKEQLKKQHLSTLCGMGNKSKTEDEGSGGSVVMKLHVPQELLDVLVEDWEAVTNRRENIPLPRKPTVIEILQEFTDYVVRNKPVNLREHALLIGTIVSGLQCYFDKSLGSNLLYRFERTQYSEIRKKSWTNQGVTGTTGTTEREMSSIYGGEHLLRMIVALPQMIAQTSLDVESVALIRDYVDELLLFMLKGKNRYFLTKYASPLMH